MASPAPGPWIVEVSAARDVSRDTLSVALRDAESLALSRGAPPPAVVLVLVSDPGDGTSSEECLAALQPFRRMVEQRRLHPVLHLERSARREQGICEAALRLGAVAVYVGTRRSLLFRAASQSATLSAYCEAHLPAGCTLVVVRGTRKIQETLCRATPAPTAAHMAPSLGTPGPPGYAWGAAAPPGPPPLVPKAKGAAKGVASRFLRAFSLRAPQPSLPALPAPFLPSASSSSSSLGLGRPGNAFPSSRDPSQQGWGSAGTAHLTPSRSVDGGPGIEHYPQAGHTQGAVAPLLGAAAQAARAAQAAQAGGGEGGSALGHGSLATVSERFSHAAVSSLVGSLGMAGLGSSLRHSDRWECSAIPEWIDEEDLDGGHSSHGPLRPPRLPRLSSDSSAAQEGLLRVDSEPHRRPRGGSASMGSHFQALGAGAGVGVGEGAGARGGGAGLSFSGGLPLGRADVLASSDLASSLGANRSLTLGSQAHRGGAFPGQFRSGSRSLSRREGAGSGPEQINVGALLQELNKLQESAQAAAQAAQRADQEAREAREESRKALAVAEAEVQRRAQAELALERQKLVQQQQQLLQQQHQLQQAQAQQAQQLRTLQGLHSGSLHLSIGSGGEIEDLSNLDDPPNSSKSSEQQPSPAPSDDSSRRRWKGPPGLPLGQQERRMFSPAGSHKSFSRFFPGTDDQDLRRSGSFPVGSSSGHEESEKERGREDNVGSRNTSSVFRAGQDTGSGSEHERRESASFSSDSRSHSLSVGHGHSAEHGPSGPECRRFSAQQLEAATGGFCDRTRLLGKGAFGSVYLGELHGCQVAVKRLATALGGGRASQGQQGQGSREFQTEVEVLSRIRHPHIVLLMGHCPETSTLVYEYMAGASLHDRLKDAQLLAQGPSSERERSVLGAKAAGQGSPSSYAGAGSPARAPPGKTGRVALQWPDRFRIAAEVSGALLFLHQHDPPILHRDLKPGNILLNASDISKVADVGLARLIRDSGDEDESRPITIRGTMGYIDPDELATGELSVASDTYAFGLILLQLLTGITSIKQVHKMMDEASGPGGARDQPRVREAVVARLDAKAGRWPEALAGELARVALRCVERHRENRAQHDRDAHPLLMELAKRAQEERERRQQQMDARFICPLSHERMRDPVVAADGFTYERSHIQKWLEHSQVSPVTGTSLVHAALTPNNTLAALLQGSI